MLIKRRAYDQRPLFHTFHTNSYSAWIKSWPITAKCTAQAKKRGLSRLEFRWTIYIQIKTFAHKSFSPNQRNPACLIRTQLIARNGSVLNLNSFLENPRMWKAGKHQKQWNYFCSALLNNKSLKFIRVIRKQTIALIDCYSKQNSFDRWSLFCAHALPSISYWSGTVFSLWKWIRIAMLSYGI